jgi:hypothetical protein
MQGVLRLSVSPEGHPVWAALFSHEIGPADAPFPFVARLARENGWTPGHAQRVLLEYKRFCFLAVTGSEPATPSDAVDQAWHLHLTYSRDYWERFCPQILGKPLHHDPARGGAMERGRFFEQYARTLRRYEQVFGEAAPADIWPGAAQRLLRDPLARRVHPDQAIIVPRRLVRRAAMVLAALLLVGVVACLSILSI